MPTRRQFLTAGITTVTLAPLLVWLTGPDRTNATLDETSLAVRKSDGEWQRTLTPARYRVLRRQATERPFSSPLDHETGRGTYVCAGCGRPVFLSATKFDSGTGWPSFWAPVDGAVGTSVDRSWFMVRTEVHCASCGGHLGHLFADGPRPTGLRYCINGLALEFRSA
jgi:peptide-methionine (R)-S-oxide reductase